ncbi:hypothetical protein ACGLHS_31730 [Variovorax sp. VaC1]|uniref:hypothetical protein n=1 Tax=Variovorax sp. VaC1 TaxID=3373132 RepID=UPI00374A728C
MKHLKLFMHYLAALESWWYYHQHPIPRLLDEALLQGKKKARSEMMDRLLISSTTFGWTKERMKWEIQEQRRIHGIREMTVMDRACASLARRNAKTENEETTNG